MQPAFVSFFLTALHLSILVDCRPSPGLPEQQGGDLHQRRRAGSDAQSRGALLDRPTGTEQLHSESLGPVRNGINRGFLIVLPIRTRTSNSVSIFDMKRNQFLCMDSTGELFNYRKINREECLFQRISLDMENHHAVFYSSSSGLLLEMDGAEVGALRQEKSLKSLERFLLPLARRPKRSQEVNPSDPLRSESHLTNPAKDHLQPDQPDQDQAISKETITSCDDPLKVLQHPNGPVSPVKTNIAIAADQPEEDRL